MGAGAVTGGGLGNATGSISISTADLLRAVSVSRSAGRQIEAALGGIDRGTKRAEQGIKSLDISLKSLAGGLGIGLGIAGALQIGRVTIDLAKSAAQADASRGAFDRLATGVGESGDRMFAAMRKASDGMISDARLVGTANQAMLLKAADTGEEMATLLEIARVRAEASGKSFEDAFSRLSLGIGKREPEILDEIGLVLRLIPAYAQYAAELGKSANQLTEIEKTQALYNEVVRQSKDLIDQSADAGDNASKKFQRYEASIENAKKATGEFLLTLGLAEGLEAFGKQLESTTKDVNTFRDNAIRVRTELGLNPLLLAIGLLPPEEARAEGIRGQIRGHENIRSHLQEGIEGATRRGGEAAQIAEMEAKLRQVNAELGQFRAQLALAGGVANATRPFGHQFAGGAAAPAGFTLEQLADQRNAKLEFETEIQGIERDAAGARLDATRQYESQRTETIASYEQTIAREAEDFGRQRARAQAQFQKQIADIAEDAGKREANWQEDLAEKLADFQSDSAERIADAQEDAAKRIAEIEEDYHKNRERAERDHRDKLMDAAARLDATAVFQEQRNFARQSADAKEAHDEAISDAQESLQERIDKERENLAERIADEQEAHAERLADAREADAERLADLQESHAEQQRLEDEDRALRLSRMAEDHAAQLASLSAANAERMAEIDRQKADELKAAQDAHLQQLADLGIYNKAWKAIQDAREREALESWGKFWTEFNKALKVFGPMTEAEAKKNQWSGLNLSDPTTYPGFAAGGWVGRDGPIMAHAGEYVLNRQQAAMQGGARSATLNLAAGAIVVNAAPGMNVGDLAAAVRSEIVSVFGELAN